MNGFLRSYYIYIYRHYLIGAEECTVNLINPLASDYEYVGAKSSDSSEDFN